MKKRHPHVKSLVAVSALTGLFWVGTPTRAQSVPARDDRPAQDNDAARGDRGELFSFNQFLESHPEIGEQVRKDPSLVDKDEFVRNHPALRDYLRDHPGVREQLRNDPNAFMRADNRLDRREDMAEVQRFREFLDSHREVADQLHRDPKLVDDDQFVRSHPELADYLRDHPEVREQLRNNPDAFMRQDDRLDNRQDDRLNNRENSEEMRRFDEFLDGDREVADRVRRDPKLVDDEQFVRSHPELADYLRDHPEVREQLRNDPDAFMHRNDRLNDRDNSEEMRHFDEFLDGHREVADQVRRDPKLVDDEQFVRSHPELDDYLRDHPGVRDQLRNDPDAFSRRDRDNDFAARNDGFAARNDYSGRSQDRDRDQDRNRESVARFDEFLDGHPEIAEQLRKDPSLVDNREFEKNHPALGDYLRDHPEVRNDIRSNPNAFMRHEDQFDHMNRDRDHGQYASFREFLGAHADISDQLKRDPSVVKNHEYMENHPEFRDYLNAHADVQAKLMQDPQGFMRSQQQFNNNGRTFQTPTTQPKPQQ